MSCSDMAFPSTDRLWSLLYPTLSFDKIFRGMLLAFHDKVSAEKCKVNLEKICPHHGVAGISDLSKFARTLRLRCLWKVRINMMCHGLTLRSPNDEADKKLSKAATKVIVCDVINDSFFSAWLDP
jgi:hypothetical protein